MMLACLMMLLTVTGCGKQITESANEVRITIEENSWAEIENNGQTVTKGEDAVFHIKASEGFSLTGTDYSGRTDIWQEDGDIVVTFFDVRYPTRISLNMTTDNFVIRYEPNGGEGEAFTVVQEIKYHKRPNTENANVKFIKQSSTLYAWNTEPDGSGEQIGLGSRVTVENEGITLFAQWAEWADARYFEWYEENGEAVITKCSADQTVLVIPAELGTFPVTRLEEGAFDGNKAETVIFPDSLRVAEKNSFVNTAVKELYLFDNIEVISDDCFSGKGVEKLHINAKEAPYASSTYKESCYADKLDLLILSQDRNRIVFYGGCSMWYNLDMGKVLRTVGDEWYPVNMGLNGTVSSEVQLQIMLPYLHEGDVFFHTPELSSDQQMMRTIDMTRGDTRLWAGIEYNYDMLMPVDFTVIQGELDSLCIYLDSKKTESDYTGRYVDSRKRTYFGEHGEIPFQRYEPEGSTLGDEVYLNTDLITEEGTQKLKRWYESLQERGLTVFVSYACINMDALTAEEQLNGTMVDEAFRNTIDTMPGVVLLSDLSHFKYRNGNFFDTNYHLLSDAASSCTNQWLKALKTYLTTKT